VGISTQVLEKPAKWKWAILNSSITNVTIYKAMAEEIHLNKPNVNKFRGKSKRLITGLTINEVTTKANPVKSNVRIPLSKTKPENN